jgi:hypothetical protein
MAQLRGSARLLGLAFALAGCVAPGAHDVCVWVGDAGTGSGNVYADVSLAGMTP